MADVRDPVGVGLEHGRTTSPQSAAVKDSDLRAAARELRSAGADPTVVHGQRALFVAFVIVLVVSVIWVREFETPTCPTKSVSAGDIRTNDQPNRGLRADTAAGQHACASAASCRYPPLEATSLSPVPAEILTPAPSPQPRLPRLHDLFPRLFPGG